MNSENDQGKSVNGNDNQGSSWLRMDDLDLNAKCAPFIPLADWLIAKHCKKWWKNHPETWDYQYAQFGICTHLFHPQLSKEWTLRFIAIDLECDPLPLMNDQETLDKIPVSKLDAPSETKTDV